jgi:hypothetical protein
MSAEANKAGTGGEDDEDVVSRAELQIEREKIQIERERLTLERERLAAERERGQASAAWLARAEGRGIARSTLVLVAVICLLIGGMCGFLAMGPYAARASSGRLEALFSATGTNTIGKGGSPIRLRSMDASGGSKAYLLILE